MAYPPAGQQAAVVQRLAVPPPALRTPAPRLKSKRPFVKKDDKFIIEFSLGKNKKKDKKKEPEVWQGVLQEIVDPPQPGPYPHGLGQPIPVPPPAPMAPGYHPWQNPPPAYQGARPGYHEVAPDRNEPVIVQAFPPRDHGIPPPNGDHILRAQIEREREARQAARNADELRRQAEHEFHAAERLRRRERDRAEAERRHLRHENERANEALERERIRNENLERARHREERPHRDDRGHGHGHRRRSASVVVNNGRDPDDEIIDIVEDGVRLGRRRYHDDAERAYAARRQGLMDENERLAREAARLVREAYHEPRRHDRRRRGDRGDRYA